VRYYGTSRRATHPSRANRREPTYDKYALSPVSAIIPAFSLERWARLERAVETARLQSHRAVEVIVPIDRNPELLDRATSRWVDMHDGSSVMVIDDSGVEADDAERTLHAGSTAPAAGSAPVWHATPRPSVRPAKSSPSAKTPGPTRTSSSGWWRPMPPGRRGARRPTGAGVRDGPALVVPVGVRLGLRLRLRGIAR
jgi:hypothetical protein